VDSVNYNIMPDIFEVELPNGQIVEIESDSTPTGDQLNSLLTEVLPKYRVERPKSKAGESPSASELSEGIFDTFPFNTRESRVARGATPTAIKNTKFYEAFKAAKIGESVVDDESKNTVIKTSDDEFVSPTVESSKYKEQTSVESGARAASLSLGPTAVALKAGSEAASRMPGPLPVKIGAGIIAGGAAALGARAIQGRALDVIDPETNRLYEAGYETNPTASFVGEVAATAPFMRPGISRLSARRNVANVAGGAGIGGAIQTASELYGAPEGELMREGAGKRIAIAAATEGVLNRPTRLGRDLGIGNIARQPKPAPKAPAEPAAPATPTLVTQIDSGVAPSTIAEGNTASEIAGSKDLIRMLGTPDASGRSDPTSVMERLVNPASAETPKSAAESARTLDLPSKRAAESAVVFEDLPVDPIKDPISTSLIKSREIVMKEIEDFIGPMKPTSASEASNLLDLASQKTSNIKTQAMQRAVGRQQAEQINAAIEKVIGVKDPLTFTAQETELAKRLAAADVNYAGVEGQAPVLRDFLGQDVVYNGYTGRLTQSDDGKIVVTFPFRRKGGAQEIVVEGASSFDDVAKSLGVYPKNPIEIPQALPASSADAAPTGVSGAGARAASVVDPIQPIASRVDEVPQSTLSKIEETMESRPVENELEIRQRRLEQTKERLGSGYSEMQKEARAVKRTARNSFGYEKLNAISKKYGVSISEVLDSVDINRGLGASSGASADAQAKGKRKFKGVSQAGNRGSVLIPGENRAALQARFAKVHNQQRYEGPEDMFDYKKNKDVDGGSGIWTHMLEHGGDLVHRSSYSGTDADFGGGGIEYGASATLEKAQKILSYIKSRKGAMPISQDVAENIENNWKYRVKTGKEKRTLKEFQNSVKEAGERYSSAYEKIEPVTEVQKLGRDAAIAIGRFDFASAEPKLERLIKLLDTPDWEKNYWKPLPSKGGMSDQSAFINPTLLVDAGSTFIGATLGYQVGDTQEERLRNAAIGAAIGAGGSVGARALSRAMSKSPKVVSAIKAKSPNIIQSLKKDFNNLKGDFKKDTADYLFDDEGIVPAQDTPYDNTRILGDGMVANAMREALLGMDREMESINPRLFGRLSSYENDRNVLRKKFTDQVEKYSFTYRKLITDPSDQAAFSMAVKNGDVEGLSAIAAKYPDVSSDIISAYNDTRSMLKEIYRLLVESGRDVNEVSNFFPRSVGDYKGLSKELGREDMGVLDSAFNEYQRERGINRELDSVEKAKVISQMLGGTFTTGKKPSFLKGRKIEEVTEKISKYYDPDDVALEKYVVKAAQDIINRKYYGNSEIPVNYKDINIEGTFGSVIAEELASGNINATDQKRIVKILQSRREMDRISDSALVGVTNALRNITSLGMLGDVSSSIPQLSDVAITVQNSGLRSGVKGTKNTLSMVSDKLSKNVDPDSLAKGKISLADLAIGLNTDDINQFALTNKGYLAKSTEAVLKRTVGIFDRFGKETLVNSAYDQFKRASSDMNSVEGKRLRSKYGKVFPEDFDQMVSDLNSGQVTDRVKLLLVTELSKLQPVLPSSMPMFYARSPGGRLLYTLKSFYIRQLNRIRSEGLDKIVKGWRTDNMGSVAEGFAWMGQYLAIMGAANASVDLAKEYLFNRESDPKEIAIANLMKIGGFSKYTALDAARMGWGSAALEWFFPFGNIANDIGEDIILVVKYLKERNLTSGKTYEDFLKESRSVKYTPGFGKEIYNLYGKGAEDEKKRQFDASRGIKQPTAAQSIINLIDASYKDDGK
jgi:hypothetical protein